MIYCVKTVIFNDLARNIHYFTGKKINENKPLMLYVYFKM